MTYNVLSGMLSLYTTTITDKFLGIIFLIKLLTSLGHSNRI